MFFHQSLQFCACLSALLISVFCQVLTSGNYSRLCADILFARSMGYYIIQVSSSWIKYVAKIHTEVERFCLVTSQVYVPSSLIVCMSWVSFSIFEINIKLKTTVEFVTCKQKKLVTRWVFTLTGVPPLRELVLGSPRSSQWSHLWGLLIGAYLDLIFIIMISSWSLFLCF